MIFLIDHRKKGIIDTQNTLVLMIGKTFTPFVFRFCLVLFKKKMIFSFNSLSFLRVECRVVKISD